MMKVQKIENYIVKELPVDDQKVALNFVEYLRDNNVDFIKDSGYWKNKIYYLIKFNNEYVCFIAIKDPDEKENRWTVWSDDMNSGFLAEYEVDNKLKDNAWKHIDFCGKCGSCGGGRHKKIFGKDFYNVCGCTFRFDNPNIDDLETMKKIIEIRIKEILDNSF